jgi:hypothetical protein
MRAGPVTCPRLADADRYPADILGLINFFFGLYQVSIWAAEVESLVFGDGA